MSKNITKDKTKGIGEGVGKRYQWYRHRKSCKRKVERKEVEQRHQKRYDGIDDNAQEHIH